MDCLSEEVLNTEFNSDSKVWVVLDKENPSTYLLFPKNENTLALWAFTKKEDADHLAHTLKKLAPNYKEMELVIDADSLQEIRDGAKKNKCLLCVMSPNDSREFFKKYEETLAHYYGF